MQLFSCGIWKGKRRAVFDLLCHLLCLLAYGYSTEVISCGTCVWEIRRVMNEMESKTERSTKLIYSRGSHYAALVNRSTDGSASRRTDQFHPHAYCTVKVMQQACLNSLHHKSNLVLVQTLLAGFSFSIITSSPRRLQEGTYLCFIFRQTATPFNNTTKRL